MRLLSVVIIAAMVAPLAATQFEPKQLISPIVNKPFQVVVVPPGEGNGDVLATDAAIPDMGTDEDGCRHTSGISEYDHYIATDPFSYFSALSIEWDQRGRFRGFLPDGFVEWVTGTDGFFDEWAPDKSRLYNRAVRQARARGELIPPQEEWVIPQESIAIEKRYRYALECYRRRGATQSFLGKIAMSGAWALRVRMNKPIVHTFLAGGIEEVNERLARTVDNQVEFNRDRFTEAYRAIYRRGGLTNEGFFIAGTAYLGFVLRQGNLAEAKLVIDEMRAHFAGQEDVEIFNGLMQNRSTILSEYVGFLNAAVGHFTVAIANEEFPRTRLPEVMFVTAESMRRSGDLERSYDWYLTLAQMDETQPRSREQIRGNGGVPSIEAPRAMLLGWRADEMLDRIEAQGVEARTTVRAVDRALLDAIRIEGLGTMDYINPEWTPRTGESYEALMAVMRELGKATLEFHNYTGDWPASLGEMWMLGAIRDRNRYNRFYCPVTGEALVYHAPLGAEPGRDLILISSPEPVETPQGRRYIAFTAGLEFQLLEEAPATAAVR